jgi:hypothetical protein
MAVCISKKPEVTVRGRTPQREKNNGTLMNHKKGCAPASQPDKSEHTTDTHTHMQVT